jgi:hypothetical protein
LAADQVFEWLSTIVEAEKWLSTIVEAENTTTR